MTLQEIIVKAIDLGEEDRANLAAKLIDSLDVSDQRSHVLGEEPVMLMTHEEFHQIVKER